jgi:hypothetical protein
LGLGLGLGAYLQQEETHDGLEYLVDEKTLEPKVFDDWTDAQVEAHVWSYSDIEEVRRG